MSCERILDSFRILADLNANMYAGQIFKCRVCLIARNIMPTGRNTSKWHIRIMNTEGKDGRGLTKLIFF